MEWVGGEGKEGVFCSGNIFPLWKTRFSCSLMVSRATKETLFLISIPGIDVLSVFSWAGLSSAQTNHHQIECSGCCDLWEKSSQVLSERRARPSCTSVRFLGVFHWAPPPPTFRPSHWVWTGSSFKPDNVLEREKQKHSQLFPAFH